jgi:hypothetical protein|tara:strand:- start:5243 stop:5665 length:423 start_codon:yes stop_codon:yes gene_type:complete
MGNKTSIRKIGFEDIKFLNRKGNRFIIINTLHETEQGCLIKGTISPNDEVSIINSAMSNPTLQIVIYGKNFSDESIFQKYQKLLNLGFNNVYVYPGGIFEWLLLQDIYGDVEFPTTSKELDILKFKPKPILNKLLLSNSD